jgi:hypothetical protein
MTPEEFEAYATSPELYFDEVMSIGPGHQITLQDFNQTILKIKDTGYSNPDEYFEIKEFPAAYNTVTLSKLILMEPSEIDRLLSELGSSLRMTEPNIMLGFIRSLDEDNQWLDDDKKSEKMLFARETDVYQKIFMRQTGEQP